ncbi:hypothetical protein ACET3Z_000726 [Daucus carota]
MGFKGPGFSNPARDEYGLPSLKGMAECHVPKPFDETPHSENSSVKANIEVPDPFKDKMKEKLEDSPPTSQKSAEDQLPKSPPKPLWSSVVKKQPPIENLSVEAVEEIPATAEKNQDPPVFEKPPVEVKDDGGNCSNAAEGWTTVGRKPIPSKPCPNPISSADLVELPIYKALAKSMSKSQLKRARRAVGKNSPKKKSSCHVFLFLQYERA